jgi:serralysin
VLCNVALILVSFADCSVSAARSLAPRDPAPGTVTRLPPVSYTAIDGHTEVLVPWQGRNVSVLVQPDVSRDSVVMAKLVTALDRAWDYYAATAGHLPASAHSLNGRDEIAEVSTTCGAGCTYIGATGTEILIPYFESMYQQLADDGLYDQIPFYELGRSFWFWSAQLAFHPPDQDPVVTGFAVLMRFQSMAAAGVNGGPFNGTPFATFKSQVAALAGVYEADPSLTFAETLAQSKSPGAYGGTDFWASLMMQLAQRHGGEDFIKRFWRKVDTLPAASSTAGAVANWEKGASYAACVDLGPVFHTRWGFPRPDSSVTPRPPADTVPEPSGSCAAPAPKRGDYKNAAQFCKADQAFLEDRFGQRYRNFGKCVSSN